MDHVVKKRRARQPIWFRSWKMWICSDLGRYLAPSPTNISFGAWGNTSTYEAGLLHKWCPLLRFVQLLRGTCWTLSKGGDLRPPLPQCPPTRSSYEKTAQQNEVDSVSDGGIPHNVDGAESLEKMKLSWLHWILHHQVEPRESWHSCNWRISLSGFL